MEPRRVLLIRRRRPLGERAAKSDAAVLAGPDGVGRMLEVLAELGHDLVAPGTEIAQWRLPFDVSRSSLEEPPVDGRFDVVVLGSHLVNTPDPLLRPALLAAARRHLRAAGVALVEHHPLDWADTAAETWSERDGLRLGMVDVRAEPPFVSATSIYELGSLSARQVFRARVLSDEELDAALASAGLRRTRRLGPTWIEGAHATASLS